jgi:hypothetical protein
MNQHLTAGAEYKVEHIRDGQVIGSELVHNLMPTEGANHVLGVALHGDTQVTTWYIGIYGANYTPQLTDTAATFPGAATELTTYAESARVVFNESAPSGGVSDNSANKAEFTSNANATVYGGFIVSASGKGSTSGVLLSAVKFASPKTFNSGDVLRVTAGFTLASV